MKKIVIASHGKLAEGFLDTLALLGVNTATMVSLDFYGENSAAEEDVEELMRETDDDTQLIIFTDIMFGSVNQMITRLAANLAKKNVRIITGFNLPVVLAVAMGEDVLTDDRIHQLVQEGRDQLMVMTEDTLSKQVCDDDIFEE